LRQADKSGLAAACRDLPGPSRTMFEKCELLCGVPRVLYTLLSSKAGTSPRNRPPTDLALPSAKAKIVEIRNAIGFRPHADITGFGEGSILDFEELLAVEEDGHEVAVELHP